MNCLLYNFFFEVGGPGELDEGPHQQGRRHRKASMIKETDRNESKNEWIGRAPVPEVLMRDVECDDGNSQEDSFQRAESETEFKLTLKSPQESEDKGLSIGGQGSRVTFRPVTGSFS